MRREEPHYRRVVDEYTDYLVDVFVSFLEASLFDGLTVIESLKECTESEFLKRYNLNAVAWQRLMEAFLGLGAISFHQGVPSTAKLNFSDGKVAKAAALLDKVEEFESQLLLFPSYLQQEIVQDQLQQTQESRRYLQDSIAYDMLVVRKYLTPEATLLGLKTAAPIADKLFHLHSPQIFDHYQSHSQLLQIYGKGFASSHIWSDLDFLDKLSFAPGETVVDVGGCFGNLGRLLLPLRDVKYHCLDLPALKDTFKVDINSSTQAFGHRFQFVPGNFFDHSSNEIQGIAGKKFNKLFLGWILHDWNDEQCLEILKKCSRHMLSDSELLVFEILPNERKMAFNFTDWLMLVMADGHERTARQYEVLFQRAGLKAQDTTMTKTGRSMMRLKLL
ncbi:MAG TPA: methyltransferase [Bacteriovoracaceae bacterium]|nr:methyltransferase [Bacteriovoracaceae bacterium]